MGAPNRDHSTTNGVATAAGPLQTALLLVLLFPVVAAIYYPFRRRPRAALPPAPAAGVASSGAQARPLDLPLLDPFTLGVVGLAGRGAIATARALALAALGGNNSLVVIPRPDATRLFGLDDDEFLDEHITELFIPGNLDAALAFLETELTIRKRMGTAPTPRLLLIADCAEETDRIRALLAHHPGDVSALLMGPWTGDRATVEGDGRVHAPPTLAVNLPARLPTISGAEARNRLHASIALPPPVRRRPSRRSTARRA